MLEVQPWKLPAPFKSASTGRKSRRHNLQSAGQGLRHPNPTSNRDQVEENPPGDSSENDSPKFDVQDPSQTIAWGGRLPSRRRAVTGFASGALIVLVSNLGGITGTLLGLDNGALAAKLHLDVLYPVKGFKRCLDARNGFEFQYPSTWLADQRMFRRNAERQESSRGLDLPSVRPRKNVAEPVAAFGPPGSSGELNISTIVAPIQQGFTLSSLGGAQAAGERFLSTTIAPEGSQLQASLLTVSERTDEYGQLYYSLEYTVTRPGNFSRHNISTYASRNGVLFTLNAQCPEASWDKYEQDLQRAAASFRVINSGPPPPGMRPPPRAY